MPDSRASTRTARERTVAEKVSSHLLFPRSSLPLTPRSEDRALAIDTEVQYIATMMSPLSSGMEGSAARVAQYGTSALAEGLPALLKVLQTVATIHPFLQRTLTTHLRSTQVTHLPTVAVGTFMVAVELDLKRRENDKKINLLFDQMRDMMSVLAE